MHAEMKESISETQGSKGLKALLSFRHHSERPYFAFILNENILF